MSYPSAHLLRRKIALLQGRRFELNSLLRNVLQCIRVCQDGLTAVPHRCYLFMSSASILLTKETKETVKPSTHAGSAEAACSFLSWPSVTAPSIKYP